MSITADMEFVMDTENPKNQSVKVNLNQSINAPAQDVFPLACPVMEYKWIPDWKCELIHCPNGHAELGVIFKEIFTAPILTGSITQKTTWTAVLYEPNNYRIHYKLENEVSTSLYKIEFEDDNAGGTKSRLELTYAPINQQGLEVLEKGGEAKIRLMLSVLSLMLKHYSEHDEMVKTSEILKLTAQVKEMTTKDKIQSLLNKLVRVITKDKNREKFFKGLPIIKVKSTESQKFY
jgi:hypothetical protein